MAQGQQRYFWKLFWRLGKPIVNRYLAKPRADKYEGIEVVVPPGVFHPRFFFSTRLMLAHLHKYDLKGKTLLEIGAGSGLVAIWCAKQGATTTATDINPLAVETVRENAARNQLHLQVLESDLFEQLPEQRFDFVVVNPPYYPKDPQTPAAHAWYCGAGYEYFERFFENLHRYRNPDSKVLMVLSEDCDISRITTIAGRYHWDMEMIHPHRKFGEWSFIFSLRYKRVG